MNQRNYIQAWKITMFIYLLIAVNLISIFVCHYIAKSRGAKRVYWGIIGAIFGPLAIPFAMRTKS